MKFKMKEGLLADNEGKKACKAYFDLGKDIRHQYQSNILNKWVDSSGTVADDSLKNHLL